MIKRITGLVLAGVMALGIVSAAGVNVAPVGVAEAAQATQKITYKGKVYTVPAKTNNIVITGAVEALEDALVLNFKPKGALTVGGEFPSIFSKITSGVTAIGEKAEPDLEAILKLKPDIILSSTKFPAETNEKLAKIATTIPVSHIATDWMDNLKLLAALTGKQKEATTAILKYQKELKEAKVKLAPKLKDKKVIALRIRSGSLFLYPQDVFFNRSLYADLGATVPKEVQQVKAQQNISLESFAAINPDYIFVQFSADENKDNPKALEELQKNAIWKSLKAVKGGNVFVNLVDPLAQGGTAFSKFSFLEALMKTKLYTGK
ncbi:MULTISPECIES: ABC transporter substrate-binding protein [Paenibacillus]|jgi:iron complex transport system substrate-binding protein|uniref:ABC transporter substrate-binding protein n=1 Tax=Paenibacillus TaxID=44249 RepID=UPI0004F6B18B|nr:MULTISPECIES: ABC transporter substrate-binding protein [unclassified Paenibacillus]AIQ29624.1 iron-uptake system-binding protein [Paenibacillus sp. FSL P4-0081]KHL93741.1 iron-uptake system-binding protein [Paenibacillus sp. IHB B 3415]OMF26845.1 iron-uptake system-binding protein [Paenibacillus sp. FSL H8-0259]